MSVTRSLASLARRAGRMPPVSAVLFHPYVRRNLQSLPGLHVIYGRGWHLIHPFDTEHGTETSGYVPAEELPSSPFADASLNIYGGSQPSILHTALAQLPGLETFCFVDLGTGKGRPVLVAAQLPFREVIGVELSAPLAQVARRNQGIFGKAHPHHAPIRIENADAAVFPLPAGDVVLFLYNPFGAAVMRRVVANIEAALAASARSLFVIYYNPVYAECLDASPQLSRYYAANLPYAAHERGFGPDETDAVVIWQGGSALPARPGADALIQVVKPGVRAEITASAPGASLQ